jgi:glycosyltransferase involved in cell wall biosynthesis
MPDNRAISISIVIAVHNGGIALRRCLAALANNRDQFGEFLVVDDGSTDESAKYAAEFGACVLRVGSRRGPANGRNIGASAATGDVVVFLDADVCVQDDTIPKIRQRFENDPDLGAVFGSYDSEPDALEFTSQFRNLLHCYIHQTSKHRASTFWAGCGAIRREIFLEYHGFDISYSVPCIEDIELGMRLVKKNVNIALDPTILVKHLKRFTFPGMVANDIRQRGIPWTLLILASQKMPNDLNLSLGSRTSVALTALLCLLSGLFAFSALMSAKALLFPEALLWTMVLGSIVAVNLPFYSFLAARRNYRFAVGSIPLHLVYFFACGTAFVLGVAIYALSQMALKFKCTVFSRAEQFGDYRRKKRPRSI